MLCSTTQQIQTAENQGPKRKNRVETDEAPSQDSTRCPWGIWPEQSVRQKAKVDSNGQMQTSEDVPPPQSRRDSDFLVGYSWTKTEQGLLRQ